MMRLAVNLGDPIDFDRDILHFKFIFTTESRRARRKDRSHLYSLCVLRASVVNIRSQIPKK